MKTPMRYILGLLFLLLIVQLGAGQEYNIGIRAGQNYSTISGATEANEKIGYSGGFHFGINFQYNIGDQFGVKAEILYNQNGYNQKLGSEENPAPSYYMIRRPSGGLTFEQGEVISDLEVSNAYITFPITAQFQVSRKWEVFAGGYLGILIGPTGRGLLRFTSTENPEEIFFRQSLDYSYNSDVAGGLPNLNGFGGGNTSGPLILADGEITRIPRAAGAYYQFLQKTDNLFKGLDYGLTGGVNYFLNRGFYIGLRIEYGLRDITNTAADRSMVDLNQDNSLILRDDSDKNFGFQASFGFRF